MEKKRRGRVLWMWILSMLMVLCFTAGVSAQEQSEQTEQTEQVAETPKTGIVKIKGKQYYYNKSGKLIKNKYGYKIGKNYYQINSKGVIKKISKAQGLAGSWLDKNCKSGLSKIQKLKKAFRWSARLTPITISTKVPSGRTAAEYFGSYGFTYKRGDCNVQAATFYWMAKALGYNVKMIRGYVPHSYNASTGKYGNFSSHAWCEVKIKGKKYAFDPNLAGTSEKNKKDALGRKVDINTGWKFKYGAKSTPIYFNRAKTKQYK